MSIENYILGKFLGKGSYGEVNLAKSKIDKKWYVIKTIDLHNASKKERLFAQQEVDILSKLNHPNIVSYKESFQVGNGCLSIVMGYCEGGDLYTRLKEQAKLKKYLTETQVVEWFIQIAMALQYMHDQNILHRDLKTQNIFLSKTKIIKLGDLGIARVLDNNVDMATTMIGTPYYMSPELFSNKPYNAKSDIWALGCCVYEMATLKHAFNATDMSSLVYKILKGKLPLMPQHYSRDLQEIIKTMLMHNPSSRPSAARLLRHPFIKSHIVLFLEGSENRRRSDTKSRNIPVQNSSDSGFFGEPDLQPVATLSKVEIEIVEDKSKSHNLSDENQDPQDNRLSSDKDNISEAFQNKKLFAKNNISKNSKEQVLSKKCNNSEVPGDKLLPLHKNDISVDPKDNLIDLKEKKNPVEPSNNNRSNVNDQKNGKKLSMNENNNPAEVRKIISNRIKAKLQQKKDEEIKKFSTNEKDVKNCLQQDDSKNGPVNHLPYPNQCENSQGKNGERHLSRPLPPPPCDNFKSTEFDPNGPLRSNKVNEVNETKVFSQECRPNTEARKKRRQRQQEIVKPFVSDIRQVPKKLPFAKNKVVYPYDHPDGAKDISKNIDVILSSQHKVKELNEVVKSTEELNEVVKSTKELNEVVKSTEEFNEIVKSTEEASFIKTLQQTLKMENDFTEKISPEQSIEADFVVDCPTVTGRLVDRIARLRCECISILGEELLKLAYKVIDTTNNEEQVEAALISLMGRVKYDEVGAQVLQLKFCEEFTATS